MRARPAAAHGTTRSAEPGPFTLRGWLVVAGGAASGIVILVAWLPVGALLSQRAQLSYAEGRLSQLSRQSTVLAAQTARLSTPAALVQLGRERYQLVAPGQRLIQVLTPSFTPSAASENGPYPGDPGFSPIVDPTGLGTIGAGVTGTAGASSSTTSTGTSAPAPSSGAAPGFFSRVASTLEFWH